MAIYTRREPGRRKQTVEPVIPETVSKIIDGMNDRFADEVRKFQEKMERSGEILAKLKQDVLDQWPPTVEESGVLIEFRIYFFR